VVKGWQGKARQSKAQDGCRLELNSTLGSHYDVGPLYPYRIPGREWTLNTPHLPYQQNEERRTKNEEHEMK
jgi:hypothetical protein